jgi:nucleoside-diphosphate-sugar epimerase
MKTIAITGAQGLIGSRLMELLKPYQYQIIPIDIRYHINGTANNIDITDYSALETIIKDCDGVVHLAAVSRVIWGEINPTLCNKINVDGTRNVIKACLASRKKPWLIFASSREVYGQQDLLPVAEEAEFRPLNNYARSKCIAEELVQEAQKIGLQASIMRLSGVFGGMADHFNRVIPAFCVNALNHQNLNVEGSDCLFDFTYVDDVVDGLLKVILLLKHNQQSIPPIHLTTCQPASLMEIAKLIIEISQSSSEIKIKPARTFDVGKFYGDFSRARTLLGWRPKFTLIQALEKFINDIRETTLLPYPNIKRGFDESLESYTWLPATIQRRI